MTTLEGFQERVAKWAKSKGWSDPEMNDPNACPTRAEHKLAYIALRHIALSEEAEEVRKNPDSHPLPPMEFNKGTNTNEVKVLAKLALVHTEVTEAVEAVQTHGRLPYRDPTRANAAMPAGKPEGLGPELADVIIRCFQLAGDVGIDLDRELIRKMNYNDGRSYKHGKHA